MPDAQKNMVQMVKQAAMEAVRAGKPAGLLNVTDYEMDISVSHITEATSGGGHYEAFSSHSHRYSGRKKIIVHNALVVGDEVALLQVQGGKKFLVLDRTKPHPAVGGEWA